MPGNCTPFSPTHVPHPIFSHSVYFGSPANVLMCLAVSSSSEADAMNVLAPVVAASTLRKTARALAGVAEADSLVAAAHV
eukprot:2027781-Lingulodinium_polyedra.AAC.1